MEEITFQYHHITAPKGEGISFKCPHCKKEILLVLTALEGDPDTITAKFTKPKR